MHNIKENILLFNSSFPQLPDSLSLCSQQLELPPSLHHHPVSPYLARVTAGGGGGGEQTPSMSLRALTRPTPIYWSHDGNRICLAFLFFIEIVRFGRKRKYFVGDSFDFHATAINISIVIGSKGTMAA